VEFHPRFYHRFWNKINGVVDVDVDVDDWLGNQVEMVGMYNRFRATSLQREGLHTFQGKAVHVL
jgi:hypothetical protein